MPSSVADEQLAEAVLESAIGHGYPDSEDVVAAELPSTAYPVVLRLLEKARLDAQDKLKELSLASAADVDGWIVHAKRLHQDIEDTKSAASRISSDAGDGAELQDHAQDVHGQKDLLGTEVTFSATLSETLHLFLGIWQELDVAQDAAISDRLAEAIDILDTVEANLGSYQLLEGTSAAVLIKSRITELRSAIIENLEECWNALIIANEAENCITLRHQVERFTSVSIQSVVVALSKLGLLSSKVDNLYQKIDHIILKPRLNHDLHRPADGIFVEGDTITRTGYHKENNLRQLFSDLKMIVEYLSTRLPPSITLPLSQILIPSLNSRLISIWLTPAVPATVSGLPAFTNDLALVSTYLDLIVSLDWMGAGDLQNWVQDAPRIWLSKRRETCLDEVRTILASGFAKTREVERIETQKVNHDEAILAGNKEDDWDASWSDDGDKKADKTGPAQEKDDIEEDVSAWGLDENETAEDHSSSNATDGQDEDGDNWGWGDEDQSSHSKPPGASKSQAAAAANRVTNATKPGPEERELTLREVYTITSAPEGILGVIFRIFTDAKVLAEPGPDNSLIKPAATGLLALPTLILAMYRALAPSHHAKNVSGNMYLYNDSLWLAEQLLLLAANYPEQAAKAKVKLADDARVLENFGKRAYGKEMESQRTILRDLLDGAQGFDNCITPPFAAECETAVTSTVERMREVNKQWRGVLSSSALLQALGSLLSSVVSKMIVEIEDFSDISEAESKQLALFCTQISRLEDLFLPTPVESSGDEQAAAAVPLAAVYTPSWLKFQYLAQILESSLADIKYLWTEGELALEFKAEEVVDLIEALFADSDRRRQAIGQIRRSSQA